MEILKLYFESEFPLLGGLFYKTFWFEASLYMFLIFSNFRGSFLSLIIGFWKFRNCIFDSKFPLMGESVLLNFLIWGLLIYVFDFFGILGGLFWLWFLKILKLYFEPEFPLLGGLFYKTFWFEASFYMFLIFRKFKGVF